MRRSDPRGVGRGRVEGVCEAGEDVIEGEHPAVAFTSPEFGSDGVGEGGPLRRGRGPLPWGPFSRGHLGGADLGRGIVRHGGGDLPRRGVIERGRGAAAEHVEVEVVDDFREEVGGGVDEGVASARLSGDPDAGEHIVAEFVDRGDRCRIDIPGRRSEPVDPRPELRFAQHGPGGAGGPTSSWVRGGFGCEEVGERVDLLAGRGPPADEVQFAGDLLEPVPHPGSQFLRRCSGEGDDEEISDLQLPFRDEAGGEGGDGPGLARPGARFEDGGAAWERVGDIKFLHG